MTNRYAPASPNCTVEDDLSDLDRDQLLAEVDLKWLFAGQGRWIDAQQLHRDPHYASQILKTAMDSPMQSLHACAMAMRGLQAESSAVNGVTHP
jgi:acyl dehydratase